MSLKNYGEETGQNILSLQKSIRKSFSDDDLLSGKNAKEISGKLISLADKEIRLSVERAISKRLRELDAEIGLGLTASERKEIVQAYTLDIQFKGATYKQRLEILRRNIQSSLNKLSGGENPTEEMLSYIDGSRYGNSAIRPVLRLGISETVRASQSTVRLLGSYLREEDMRFRYVWNLSTRPGRKKDICDEYAAKRYFTDANLPAYPHPFCYCSVSIELR